MKRPGRWASFAIVSLLLFGVLKLLGPVEPPPGVTLHDLTDLDQLSTAFNEAKGNTRLVLVLSPT